jgi:hypothetical protein
MTLDILHLSTTISFCDWLNFCSCNVFKAPPPCSMWQDTTGPPPLFFLVGLESELRALCLPGRCSATGATLPALFCVWYCQDRVFQAVCPGWLQTTIILISASWVTRITGVSHWYPACYSYFGNVGLTKYLLGLASNCDPPNLSHYLACADNYWGSGTGMEVGILCTFSTCLNNFIIKTSKRTTVWCSLWSQLLRRLRQDSVWAQGFKTSLTT